MASLAMTKDIVIEPYGLAGDLSLPEPGMGLVLFAHGSGSGRLSLRNRQVAEGLQAAGLGTLLFDLLTEDESADRHNVFDIPLLAGHLAAATEFVRSRTDVGRARLDAEKQIAIAPGAGHLFEEPGTLDQLILLARDWFVRHLGSAP